MARTRTKLRKAGEVAELRDQVGEELGRQLKKKGAKRDELQIARLQSAVATLDWALGGDDPTSSPDVVNAASFEDALAGALEASAQDKPTGIVGRLEALDWRIKAQLTVAFAALIVIPFYLFRNTLYDMGQWGYLGAFFVNGLSNATIILPAPGSIIIALMAERFNPVLIGMAAGVGGAIGGMTSYFAGQINTSQGDGRLSRFMRWTMFRAGIPVLFVFSVFPLLPGDVASLVAGSVRYPKAKYLAVTIAGNVVKMTFIAIAGLQGIDWIQHQAANIIRTNPFGG